MQPHSLLEGVSSVVHTASNEQGMVRDVNRSHKDISQRASQRMTGTEGRVCWPRLLALGLKGGGFSPDDMKGAPYTSGHMTHGDMVISSDMVRRWQFEL
jgi:hypothetical protein